MPGPFVFLTTPYASTASCGLGEGNTSEGPPGVTLVALLCWTSARLADISSRRIAEGPDR